jgi:1,4-alpha-glucan branching enzyme
MWKAGTIPVMAESLGRLCIVLHGHLPYVLHHGNFPHGESWLFEAAAEVYLPLLALLDEAGEAKIRPGLTIGLTPVLLEQLSHLRFRDGFVIYLKERTDRARTDAREFEAAGDSRSANLARRWEQWHENALASFEKIKRNIPLAFATRQRQILTSAATHAYLPLLLNDQMIRAQLACGTETSRRHLEGDVSKGLWLPECAYRPGDEHWMPAALYGEGRSRVGLETIIAGFGLNHFFVDTAAIANAKPIGTMEAEGFRTVFEAQLHWDHDSRGWHSPLDPVGVVSTPHKADCFAFARHPGVSQEVWSGMIGYPAAGEYLEFHRKHGARGLRYHKVTSRTTPLGEKQTYAPDDVTGKIFEHSQHFCSTIREALSEYKKKTGRIGTVVAPFDAELFGHWWFEGPRFLRDVIFTLAADPEIELATAEQVLAEQPPDKVMRLPESSWGLHGNHTVWLNDQTKWMWEIEYRAEGRLLRSLHELPWRKQQAVKEMLQRSARQLLLMQASDWPFIVHSAAATDYGIQRFSGHATRFDRMMSIAHTIAGGDSIGELENVQVMEADAHDDIFPEIDLEWWK